MEMRSIHEGFGQWTTLYYCDVAGFILLVSTFPYNRRRKSQFLTCFTKDQLQEETVNMQPE